MAGKHFLHSVWELDSSSVPTWTLMRAEARDLPTVASRINWTGGAAQLTELPVELPGRWPLFGLYVADGVIRLAAPLRPAAIIGRPTGAPSRLTSTGRPCLPHRRGAVRPGVVILRRMDIVIPLFDHFEPLDAIGPYEILAYVPGATVRFVAAEPGLVQDVLGPCRCTSRPGTPRWNAATSC
ncbi:MULTISPECIES: hypothetical protein [unclassified Streptomyces]|uniref:hypothetical protein n=1 Tax=unclassified Streptomyces TaxID=2593676 RepID=UPI00381D48DA